jgi:tetratricopeptide (TPR) repeat protein
MPTLETISASMDCKRWKWFKSAIQIGLAATRSGACVWGRRPSQQKLAPLRVADKSSSKPCHLFQPIGISNVFTTEEALSAEIPHCDRCNLDRVFLRVAPLQNQTMYGVEWRCPHCESDVLDLCPVGPLVPALDTCLNCGVAISEAGDEAKCPACELTRSGALDTCGLNPPPADLLSTAGELFDRGLTRRAIAAVNFALLSDPKLEQAWRIKFTFLLGLGFYDAAITVIQAARSHVANPDFLTSLGYALQMLNRHTEAIDAYRQYLAAAPDGEFAGVALCNIANSHRQMKNDTAAEQTYRQAIAKEPNQPTHYVSYARLLLDHRRFDEAHPIIDQGWACAKESATVARLLQDKALAFAEQMRGEDSLKCADAAIKQGADGVRVHQLRGRALALLGRLAEARLEMQRVLAIDPKNAEARRAMKLIDEANK